MQNLLVEVEKRADELVARARKEAEEEGYNRGTAEAHEEYEKEKHSHPFDADDLSALLPVLRSAYESEITTMPWRAHVIQNLIDFLEG